MKKVLFAGYTLDLGGTEKALVSLINHIQNEYEVTLVLEKKQGIFLNDIPKNVKILEYRPSENKIVFVRKAINLFKRIMFAIKHKNKYDFASSYTTDRLCSSFCARTASKNNSLWVHSSYDMQYKKEDMIKFFDFVEYNKFSKFVFVSNRSREGFVKVFPETEKRTITINNFIDYKEILEKSKEEIDMKKDNVYTFLNIGRHDESSKRLTRLIDVAELLKKDEYKFRVIFVGDGQDTEMYKNIVLEKNLKEEIIFVGKQKNPYPYFKISDSVILTSEYEGYPVVYVEAMVLDIPIITTDVSDSKQDISGKFGVVTGREIDNIYEGMKNFIENGYIIKEKFNPEKFNEKIKKQLKELIR